MESCEGCPIGTTSSVGSDYCSCKAGMFWNRTMCEDCTHGSVSRQGSLQCVTCPPDTTSSLERTFCVCLKGNDWIWDDQGAGSCESHSLSQLQNNFLPSTSICLALSGVSFALSVVLAIGMVYKGKTKENERLRSQVTYRVDRGAKIVDIEGGVGERSGVEISDEDLITRQPVGEGLCLLKDQGNFWAYENIYETVYEENIP